ncbi:adhC2 [Symbiodinium sp. CCMP2592]|nr:adhC2 [Symbiodinium sp. CCMP2592]
MDLPEDTHLMHHENPEEIPRLQDVLRDFADSDNMVSESSLRDVAGFTDEVADTLAAQLGPGPWHVEKLEQLFSGATNEDQEEEPASRSSSPAKGWRSDSPRQWSSASPLRRRHTVGFASEAPSYDADDLEDDGLCQLSALVQAALRGDEEAAKLQHLLRRTWHVAQGLEQQRHRLQDEAAEAHKQAKLQSERVTSAENARVSAEAAEAAALSALQVAGQRQVASRELIRRREEELEEARLRSEGLEAEMARQAARLRGLEERLRRAEEDRDRKVTPRASNDAAQSELLRQIASANATAEALRHEVVACEEAAAIERQRSFRLETELKESRDELTDQRARVQALESLVSQGSSGPNRTKQRRSQKSAETPALSEELLADAPDAAAGPKAVPPAACDRKARLQAQLQAQRGYQAKLSESPNKQADCKVPKSPEGLSRAGIGGRNPSAARQTGMPADMRSLSRLLSGSGWLSSPAAHAR